MIGPAPPPYADRVQTAFALTSGVNHLVVPRAAWASTPGGRPFDFGRVVFLGLFFGAARVGEVLDILDVRLRLADPAALEGVARGEP